MGVNLNHKLQMNAVLHRFDKFLFLFDLSKAFLQLMLSKEDTNKLIFLWFRNVGEGDFTVVGYRFCRVPFGLRFSPFLLMVSLYYILMSSGQSSENPDENEIKRCMYNLAYMDNLAFSSEDETKLLEAYNLAVKTFGSFGFKLQQFAGNSESFVDHVRARGDDLIEGECGFFGMLWDTGSDTLKTRKSYLSPDANTKRKILSTIQTNYDPFGINLPIMNRAKLFLHGLQCDKLLGWDTELPKEKLREWRNIARQVNNGEEFRILRNIGSRAEQYDFHVYCDASAQFIGCQLFLADGADISFVYAKNSVVSGSLKAKSIPCLELAAMLFGAEAVIDYYQQLSSAVEPVRINRIFLYTDSQISLSWLRIKEYDYGKIERKNVFVNNKLDKISELCKIHPIIFRHIDGAVNPADAVTRCVSAKMLKNTNYHTGSLAQKSILDIQLVVPRNAVGVTNCSTQIVSSFPNDQPCIVNLDRYSSFAKTVGVVSRVLMFVRNLKAKVGRSVYLHETVRASTYETAANYVLNHAQLKSFGEVHKSLLKGDLSHQLVTQMNLFIDRDGLIRVKGKLKKLKADYGEKCPVLLSKDCPISKSIIWDTHLKLKHGGIHRVLARIRKEFWITNAFTCVKKLLKTCLVCRRLNNRTVKLSQNAYRDYRINPETIPFRNVMIDHCGAYYARDRNEKFKVYILVLTCMWSRAVNLKYCRQIDKSDFLRAFQSHVLEYGVPSLIVSDNGTPIVSGVEQTISYLEDEDSVAYLRQCGINSIKFHPYPPGASKLGGAVESMVKMVKRLCSASIGNRVLSERDFDLFVQETKMLINKRPIAFKICENSIEEEFPTPLTPELVIKGYETPCVGIIPQLQQNLSVVSDADFEVSKDALWESYEQLRKVQANLHSLYRSEFISTLFAQSVDRKDRYAARNHTKLQTGDLVTIKTENMKPFQYPLAVVANIEINDLGEVVSASLRKSNGEIVRRHAEDIIFICSGDSSSAQGRSEKSDFVPNSRDKSKRASAKTCSSANRDLFKLGLA